MRSAVEIAELMAGYALGPEEQIAQTAFRQKLVEVWGISEGQRVLEIGCGQGDMTAVLADAVGAAGHVLAVDIADPNYGAPVTVGDSMRHLKAGQLGDRIDVRFGFDVLSAEFESQFDAVVLAHCTWYFESLDQLSAVLKRVRPWSGKLCLSEWDLQPRSIDQLGHFLAVLIQGQIEAFKISCDANIRTPYSLGKLRELLEGAGWMVACEELVDASGLSDGKWEVDMALTEETEVVPERLEKFVEMQREVLSAIGAGAKSLPAYAIATKLNAAR